MGREHSLHVKELRGYCGLANEGHGESRLRQSGGQGTND